MSNPETENLNNDEIFPFGDEDNTSKEQQHETIEDTGKKIDELLQEIDSGNHNGTQKKESEHGSGEQESEQVDTVPQEELSKDKVSSDTLSNVNLTTSENDPQSKVEKKEDNNFESVKNENRRQGLKPKDVLAENPIAAFDTTTSKDDPLKGKIVKEPEESDLQYYNRTANRPGLIPKDVLAENPIAAFDIKTSEDDPSKGQIVKEPEKHYEQFIKRIDNLSGLKTKEVLKENPPRFNTTTSENDPQSAVEKQEETAPKKKAEKQKEPEPQEKTESQKEEVEQEVKSVPQKEEPEQLKEPESQKEETGQSQESDLKNEETQQKKAEKQKESEPQEKTESQEEEIEQEKKSVLQKEESDLKNEETHQKKAEKQEEPEPQKRERVPQKAKSQKTKNTDQSKDKIDYTRLKEKLEKYKKNLEKREHQYNIPTALTLPFGGSTEGKTKDEKMKVVKKILEEIGTNSLNIEKYNPDNPTADKKHSRALVHSRYPSGEKGNTSEEAKSTNNGQLYNILKPYFALGNLERELMAYSHTLTKEMGPKTEEKGSEKPIYGFFASFSKPEGRDKNVKLEIVELMLKNISELKKKEVILSENELIFDREKSSTSVRHGNALDNGRLKNIYHKYLEATSDERQARTPTPSSYP